jgi:hypothetical protein
LVLLPDQLVQLDDLIDVMAGSTGSSYTVVMDAICEVVQHVKGEEVYYNDPLT